MHTFSSLHHLPKHSFVSLFANKSPIFYYQTNQTILFSHPPSNLIEKVYKRQIYNTFKTTVVDSKYNPLNYRIYTETSYRLKDNKYVLELLDIHIIEPSSITLSMYYSVNNKEFINKRINLTEQTFESFDMRREFRYCKDLIELHNEFSSTLMQ